MKSGCISQSEDKDVPYNILKLILDLKQNEKLSSEFECPVCNLPSSSPRPEDSVHRWVTTLKLNEDIKAKCVEEIKNEMPDTTKCCSHCLSCKKKIPASEFCLTCQKYYCGSCSETLHAFAVNQGHTLIGRKEDRDSGEFEDDLQILKNFVTCSKHPEEFVTFYCQDEKKFCCFACSIQFHKSCTHVKLVSTLSKECGFNKRLTSLTGLAGQMVKHIDKVIQTVKENNNENKTKAGQLGVKFQEMKQKVVNLLDMIESNLMEEGKAAVKTAAVKNQDEIDELECLKQKLKTVTRILEQVAKFTSVDQAFVCALEIEHSIEDIERQIIGKDGIVKTLGLELKTTDMFETIQNLSPNETAKLVSVTQPEANICVPEYEGHPFLRKFTIQKYASRKFLLKDTKETHIPTYSQLLFLSASRFILFDSHGGHLCFVDKVCNVSKKLVKYRQFYEPDSNLAIERHVTYLDNNVLAVGVPSRKTICLRTANESYNLKGEIECEFEPKALYGLQTGELAVAWNKPVAFGIISSVTWTSNGRVPLINYGSRYSYCEKVYFTKDTSGRQLKSFQFMAVDEKRAHIIQPCSVEKAVFCFGFSGKPVFRYSPDDLQDPKGVAVDDDGNIFICESIMDSIHVVSPEGKGITIIDKSQGCPPKPLAIGYHKGDNKFAVTESKDERARVTFFKVRRLK